MATGQLQDQFSALDQEFPAAAAPAANAFAELDAEFAVAPPASAPAAEFSQLDQEFMTDEDRSKFEQFREQQRKGAAIQKRRDMRDATIKKKNADLGYKILRAPFVGAKRALAEVEENIADFGINPPLIEAPLRYHAAQLRKGLPTPEEEGVLPGIISTLSQFGIPFAGLIGKVGNSPRMATRIMKAMGLGAAVDLAVFDEEEARLSDWLTKLDNPILNNSVTQFMKSREDDPAVVGKIRQAVEGAAIGMTADAFIELVRALKGARLAKGQKPIDPLSDDALKGLESDLGEKLDVKAVDVEDLLGADGMSTGRKMQEISDIADDLQTGARTPSILVEVDADGKPLKVLSGADDVKASQMLATRFDVNLKKMKVRTITTGSVEQAKMNAALVDNVNQQSRDAKKKLHKNFAQRTVRWAGADKWVDASADLKGALLKQGGDLGKVAVMQHDTAAGSTPKAHHAFQESAKEIYHKLDSDGEQALDDLINSRLVVEIDKRKQGKHRFPGGLTGAQHADKIKAMEMDMGTEAFTELNRKAELYFDTMKGQLGELHANKVIDDELFEKLKNFDYRPIRYLDMIDPIRAVDIGGKKISVRDSGIALLTHGKDQPIELSSREMLTQVIGRTQNRIARNNANLAMRELGIQSPDNGIVKVPKAATEDAAAKAEGKKGVEVPKSVRTPKGFSRISVMVDGKPEPIFIDQKLVGQWITQNPQVTAEWAEALRWSSGSPIVRALATGHNPGFAFTNFPRDLMHVYMTTQEYSRHLPLAVGQLTRDLAATAGDAFRKKGAYVDYIDEGGGMNFLTHQGRDVFVDAPNALRQQLDPKWEKLKKVTGYLGETSELWTRLALRNRAMRNMAKDPNRATKGIANSKEATWIARNYMDFAQGGSWAKAADHQIPYLNATIQAWRGTLRSAKNDPMGFATKTGWLMATAGGLYLANYMNHPEASKSIPDKEKQNYWWFPTGGKTVDKRGNTRHHYFRIKKDDIMKPFLWPVDASMTRFFEDRPMDESAFETMRDSLPLMKGTIPIPTLNAYATYVSNHDFWFDDEVWRGKTLPWPLSAQEFKGEGQGRPTPKEWVAFGQATGLSPERGKKAWASVVPNNPFLDLAVGGGRLGAAMLGGEPALSDREMDRTLDEVLNSMPIVRRFSHLTHPAETEMQRSEEVIDQAMAERIAINRAYDSQYNEFLRGRQSLGAVNKWISGQPEQHRKRLMKRHMRGIEIDRAFKSMRGTEGIPSSITWLQWMGQPPDVRAELFYKEWVGLDDGNKRAQMKRMGQRIKGFWSEDFGRHLGRIVNKQGREQH